MRDAMSDASASSFATRLASGVQDSRNACLYSTSYDDAALSYAAPMDADLSHGLVLCPAAVERV